MTRKTQAELKKLYEIQNSSKGKGEFANKKEFLQKVNQRLDIRVPVNEVGVLVNAQTKQVERYFIMKG